MKKKFIIGVGIILLALDWAALHDILEDEPGVRGEYATIVLSFVIFGLIIFSARRKLQSS